MRVKKYPLIVCILLFTSAIVYAKSGLIEFKLVYLDPGPGREEVFFEVFEETSSNEERRESSRNDKKRDEKLSDKALLLMEEELKELEIEEDEVKFYSDQKVELSVGDIMDANLKESPLGIPQAPQTGFERFRSRIFRITNCSSLEPPMVCAPGPKDVLRKIVNGSIIWA